MALADANTCLHSLRSRYYAPGVGRSLNQVLASSEKTDSLTSHFIITASTVSHEEMLKLIRELGGQWLPQSENFLICEGESCAYVEGSFDPSDVSFGKNALVENFKETAPVRSVIEVIVSHSGNRSGELALAVAAIIEERFQCKLIMD